MFGASKTASVSGGYQISRSLRFNSADSAYLNRTPASATNRRTWTLSTWAKVSAFGSQVFILGAGVDGDNRTDIRFDGDSLQFVNNVANVTTANLKTTAVYRDPSAWYHIVIAVDSTQATSTNRIKIYVNGVEVTSFSTSTYFSQNTDTFVNNNCGQTIGRYSITASNYFNGYMTEVNLIDGQQLTPSSFGETNAQTGVWQPKAFAGTYGTNGFYLNFSDNSNTTAATLGKDYSGNGNNWTPNNFSVTAGAGNDSLVDSPTSYGTDTGAGGEVRGNYATLNPLTGISGTRTFSNGNLDVSVTTANLNTFANMQIPTTGKWYWEFQVTTISTAPMIGIASDNSTSLLPYSVVYRSSGLKIVDDNQSAYGASFTTTDIIGIAVNVDSGSVTFYKNGTSQGAITYATSGGLFPLVRSSGAPDAFTLNFGQRAFAYTAPSGFKALCTQNLPTPTIGATTATQAGKFFNPVLYTGNGGTQSVTGVGFQPDFTWVKSRTTTNGNGFEDAVRGAGKTLESNNTSAEVNYSSYFTAFTSDGFDMALGGGFFNSNGQNYVAWNWKANGAGSTNTAGSITSTVSANTTSGFSVLTYSGGNLTSATIGHGLGVAPSMVIVKRRNAVDDWRTYHVSVGATKYMDLNTTAAAATATVVWNDTAPTSTVFTVGNSASVNASGGTYVAYCFAEVAGYSKFGSYTGNGSTTDGVFIYTGFRPKYIMFKGSSVTTNWSIFDTSRSPYNLSTQILAANDTLAEFTTADSQIDILSNGIKIRSTTTTSGINQSGASYIFAAFAEVPMKYALAR